MEIFVGVSCRKYYLIKCLMVIWKLLLGLIVQNGDYPSKNAIKICNHYEIDISRYGVIYFKDSNIEYMDLILIFEMSHKKKYWIDILI